MSTAIRAIRSSIISLLAATAAVVYPAAASDWPYAPKAEYLMNDVESEISLSRSAAPNTVSANATIWILTADGFEIAVRGSNDFHCATLRAFSAPYGWNSSHQSMVRVPHCFDAIASKTIMRIHFDKHKLALEGKSPEQIRKAIGEKVESGALQYPQRPAFAYMYSTASNLAGPAGPIGPWKPHHMIYIPYFTNAQLGGNELGGDFPFVGGQDGGATATIIIPGPVGIDPK